MRNLKVIIVRSLENRIRLSYELPDGTRRAEFKKDVTQLPQWVQERLAVLSLLSPQQRVEGLGQRLRHNYYKIEEPNDDTRSES